MKKWNKKSLRVFSRHPSHSIIRNAIPVPEGQRICIRLGSITPMKNTTYEINTVESIENTKDKFKMKSLFKEAGVSSPVFFKVDDAPEKIKFPILAKKTFRSRGMGMMKLDTQEEYEDFIKSSAYLKSLGKNEYYFEIFHNYTKEYRIHTSEMGGYFYTCRKMLKSDAENRWFRNNKNCVWMLEENELFDKPQNWDEIVADCQKAREALGLSICGFDVKVTKKGSWMILEGNSACSFGDLTTDKYINEIKKIIKCVQ